MSGKTVTAATISAPFTKELLARSDDTATLISRRPKLVGILANADEPSRLYAESTRKSCEDVHIDFELKVVGSKDQPSQPSEVEQVILESNMDEAVDGIMVYYPIFGPAEDQYLQQVVSPSKDVEGLSVANSRR